MELHLKGVIFIVGNYGSGKTEISVNLALDQKKKNVDVRVADLDLVNPYFRTREARKVLADLGIELVLPPEKYMHADLPILTPAVSGMIKKPSELTLLDVGGDDAGATVVAALGDAIKGKKVQVLQIVNPNRPYTDTIEGCMKICSEIESASKLSVTGLVGNANLIDETTVDDIRDGYDFMKKLSDKSRLPLSFITAPQGVAQGLDKEKFSCPVLTIRRQLVPPWKKAGDVSG